MRIMLQSVMKNVFVQSIKSNGFSLNYFESKKYGELDFVIQKGLKIDLLEIKSGNVEQKEGIEYFPWYMVMFYQREKEPENYIYEVDLSGL